MKILISGSSGLVGSEAVRFFDNLGFPTWGIDNNMRRDFFGEGGDTTWNLKSLMAEASQFTHLGSDIRDRASVDQLLEDIRPDVVIHAAAQPSHDLAASRPFDDFDVNAVGTLNLLEAFRRHTPEGVFVFVSTNKVYGDGPNHVNLKENEKRYDFDDPSYTNGIPEDFPVDQCLHSLFGASKLAADVLVQEYGRYFGLNTGSFRCGCLTGPAHSGVQLHGFLNYLIDVAVAERGYTIFGYKGKQVRDQLHSGDLLGAFWQFIQNPRQGEVYNMGGGIENSASVLECIDDIERICGRRPVVTYSDANRIGDHICYYSDLQKFRQHYPDWKLEHSLEDILQEMVEQKLAVSRSQ